MLRNRAVALLLCWLASPVVFALGLGPLEATSALNEPFKGRIEILGAKAEDFDTLTVGLAGEDQFQRAGIDRPAVLFKLRFAVADSRDGKDYVQVTSRDPIPEPFLNFLLELNWANGRLVREYTVLLDPPLYDPNRRMAAQATANPPAAPVVRPAAAAPMPPPAGGAGAYTGGREIGPVGATDTLWSLASANRPDQSVSVQQMMLAILRQNPDAFSNGNVNMLRRGAVLHLPDAAAVGAVSAEEAFAEVKRQHQLWQEYRQQIGATPAPQPLGTTAPSSTTVSPPAPVHAAAGTAADAHLELVAPGGTESGGKPGKGAGAGGSELLREQLDSTSQQAGDLKGKLAEAEEIIDLLQRQVNIKDQELAALQARLAELGIKQGDIGAGAAAAPTSGQTTTPPAAPTPSETTTTSTESASPPPAMEPPTAPTTPAETPPATAGSEATIEVEPEGEPAHAAAETPTAAPAGEQEIVVESPPAEPSSPSFPASLIPVALADKVPGGALGVLGIAVVLILGLFAGIVQYLLKARAERPGPVATAVPKGAFTASEDVTITAPTSAGIDDEMPTEFDATDRSLSAFDPNATVEAAAAGEATLQQAAVATLAEGDPLEEVNVYLAYERFDQAEELVKRVIAQYPKRHEYKLRLLEVYYSSNDRVAYENAARDLLSAVGESDPLWVSALAMWSEMSPDRALFAAGAAMPAAAPEPAKAFVDITGDSDMQTGEATLTHAPGGRQQALDLDLAGGGADDSVLDLTASANESEILDLTAASPADDDGGMLDLTAGEDAGELDLGGTGVLDITEGGDSGGLLEFTGGGQTDDILDISISDERGAGGGSDLLDVTRTGDISLVEDRDLLNVTAPGMRAHEDHDSGHGGALDLDVSLDLPEDRNAAAGANDALAFDISDTVAPAFNVNAEVAGDDSDALDLEFDIGGLEADDVPTVDLGSVAPKTAAGDLDLDLTMGDGDGAAEGDLDFDITMNADDLASSGLTVSEKEDAGGGLEITMESDDDALDGELSLKGAGLDAIALDQTAGTSLDEDFDFALDGTTDMDPIAADDTLDMSNVSSGDGLEVDDGTSLDDLTLELDSVVGGTALGHGDEHLDTVTFDLDGNEMIDPTADQTIVMPSGADIDRQSDADEADTKLNLAKAYIELGDAEGARSILDEVATDGTLAQQAEAKALLSQLDA